MTPTMTPAARQIIDQAMRPSPEEREEIAWALLRSVHPKLRPASFASPAEVLEYLRTKPDVVAAKD